MSKTFPEWIEPMAATLTQERFTGAEWSFERKFDGIRLLAYKNRKQIDLFSRNHLPQNLPAISKAVAGLSPRELILDGEITWGRGQVTYHVFDIMWIDGHETMSQPLEERRRLLHELNLQAPLIQVVELNVSVPGAIHPLPLGEERGEGRSVATGSSDHLAGYHDSPWEYARENAWEGVVAKRRGSVYEQRRSRNWLKMKCELAQEFVVGGFTDPQGKRVGLGALLVGYYDYASVANSSPTVREGSPPDFIYAGKIGTGFNNDLLTDLRHQLDALEIPKPPFTRAVGLPRLRAHWVRPEIVVQVGFIQWTDHGKLRHPRLLGLRTDKNARDVVKE
jgi:bifunctional non-homologous end joining protein LigD